MASPTSKPFIRNGFYLRRSDHRWIQRFRCRLCKWDLSKATHHPCRYQKKRRINLELERLLCSGVSQRRAAILLRVNPKTVVRKFYFLAEQAQLDHELWLKSLPESRINAVQFDDLETSEHSKCKPLSVPLLIEAKSRKILGFSVAQMPAKGHLVHIARKRYGFRADHRPRAWREVLENSPRLLTPEVVITSDENPHYPIRIKRHLQRARHIQVKGKRGCIAGQGELKKTGFDPLFSLNHTCAMLRANVNRLFRKTWCTTKKRDGLRAHLWIYVRFHNRHLTPEILI